jgi:hypothetical protein
MSLVDVVPDRPLSLHLRFWGLDLLVDEHGYEVLLERGALARFFQSELQLVHPEVIQLRPWEGAEEEKEGFPVGEVLAGGSRVVVGPGSSRVRWAIFPFVV